MVLVSTQCVVLVFDSWTQKQSLQSLHSQAQYRELSLSDGVAYQVFQLDVSVACLVLGHVLWCSSLWEEEGSFAL